MKEYAYFNFIENIWIHQTYDKSHTQEKDKSHTQENIAPMFKRCILTYRHDTTARASHMRIVTACTRRMGKAIFSVCSHLRGWGGTPSQVWGLPHLRSEVGGYPGQVLGGIPDRSGGGTPSRVRGGGYCSQV